MHRNTELNKMIESFSELYWLKPVDIVWDAVNAYHIRNMIKDKEIILDLGCGDGLYTALMFGGRLPKEYDRFISTKTQHQKIGKNQEGDIYKHPSKIKGLEKKPKRKINYGLELKQYHIDIAKSLGIYERILKGSFNKIPLDNTIIDKIFSIFAFYWGDDLDIQVNEVRRVLKMEGEFIVNLPSEHLFDLHIAKRISEETDYSDNLRKFMKVLDGGRRKLTCRYARSLKEWKLYFEKHGFEFIEAVPVVNEIMFVLQDISQRPFLPFLFQMFDLDTLRQNKDKIKQYLCTKVYPKLIDHLLEYESRPDVRHAYYLIRIKKKKRI